MYLKVSLYLFKSATSSSKEITSKENKDSKEITRSLIHHYHGFNSLWHLEILWMAFDNEMKVSFT